MTFIQAVAQLRHLYAQLADGAVQDQKEIATGLLSPAISELERTMAYIESLRSQIDLLAVANAEVGGKCVEAIFTLKAILDWYAKLPEPGLVPDSAALVAILRDAAKIARPTP